MSHIFYLRCHPKPTSIGPIRLHSFTFNSKVRKHTECIFPVGSSIAISNTADSYGIHDPIIQHQPINSGYHQAKRENHKQTVNPFLRSSPKTKRRTPKSIRLNVKRIEGKKDEDGSQGWVPIPYPLIKS